MDLARQRIVVTGGEGFVGRRVVEQLRVAGVDAESVRTPPHSEFDLANESDVRRMYEQLTPTVVIHLAAEVGGIGANRAAPGRFFHANMAMGLHLVEHARRHGVRRFVGVGTVCSYPRDAAVPFCEDDLFAGYPEPTNAPYGIAKRALLVMMQAYRQQYGLGGVFLMPTNLYGPGDSFDPDRSHVIPALIRKMCQARDAGAESVTAWGTGRATRDFLYVDDAARGIVAAAAACDTPEPINLGSGREIAIADLAERLRNIIGFAGRIEWDPTRPDGQPRRRLNIARAEAAFGFQPQVDLDEGLRRTIAWYEARVAEGTLA